MSIWYELRNGGFLYLTPETYMEYGYHHAIKLLFYLRQRGTCFLFSLPNGRPIPAKMMTAQYLPSLIHESLDRCPEAYRTSSFWRHPMPGHLSPLRPPLPLPSSGPILTTTPLTVATTTTCNRGIPLALRDPRTGFPIPWETWPVDQLSPGRNPLSGGGVLDCSMQHSQLGLGLGPLTWNVIFFIAVTEMCSRVCCLMYRKPPW